MNVLCDIEPKKVFSYFEKLAKIPHGSKNTKAISDFCADFAKQRNLEYYQDSDNNIIIIKEATKGYENSESIIIQGHLDMVCEKAPDCNKDMSTEGLDLAIDGDFIYAVGTTLGGDDGIAVAYALAILDSDDIEHPRLEVIFTVDEEIGMLGASSIDLSMIKGKKLLNIDSENEGILTVSCAGGASVDACLPINRISLKNAVYSIKIHGLTGGHSGVEIDKGRANANMLMGRLLYDISSKIPINIKSLSGGLKDNAITNSCEVQICAPSSLNASLCDIIAQYNKIFKNEYLADPKICISMNMSAEGCFDVLDDISTKNVIFMLRNVPFGIQEMSLEIEGLVQTSLNLGILKLCDNSLNATFSVRSSVSTQKDELIQRLKCLIEYIGGQITVRGEYPAWEYKKQSALRQLMIDIYKEQYNTEPKIEAIHAGLECGIFCGKINDLEAVSFGPDLFDIHTFNERMSISSVMRVWKYIIEILKRSK